MPAEASQSFLVSKSRTRTLIEYHTLQKKGLLSVLFLHNLGDNRHFGFREKSISTFAFACCFCLFVFPSNRGQKCSASLLIQISHTTSLTRDTDNARILTNWLHILLSVFILSFFKQHILGDYFLFVSYFLLQCFILLLFILFFFFFHSTVLVCCAWNPH